MVGAEGAQRRRSLLAPFQYQAFALLAGGQAASSVGDGLYAVALPFYVLSHHGGAVMLATVLAVYGVPRTVLIPLGGVLADRFSPWRTMMAADLIRTVAATVLAVSAFNDHASLAFLIPIALVLGAGEGLFLPSSQAIVPSLVSRDTLAAGNAIVSSSNQLASILGPVAGGVIVAAAGSDLAFAVDAGTFLFSAITLALIPLARHAAGDRPETVESVDASVAEPAPSQAGDGEEAGQPTFLELLRTSPIIRVWLLIDVGANLALAGSIQVALPVFVRNGLGGGAGGYGAVLAAFGAGSVVGLLVVGSITHPRHPMPTTTAFALVAMLALAAVGFTGAVWAAAVLFAVVGTTLACTNIIGLTAFQKWAPPQILGRMMSLLLLASYGTTPLGILIGGFLVNGLGATATFLIAAGAAILTLLAGLTSRTWREFSVD